MKIVTLLGSPRKKGNTAKVLGGMEEALKEKGCDVERINIASYKLNGCISCFKCQMTPDQYKCVQKDEANDIYAKMVSSDGVILSSPLYWWSFSAQIKPLIDRFVSQVKGIPPESTSAFSGKPFSFLMTCWGSLEDNTEPAVDVYQRTIKYLLGVDKGQLIVPDCAPDGAPGDEFKAEAIGLANKLLS